MRRSVALVERERPALAKALEGLGLRVHPSAANFLCVEVPIPGRRFFESLLRAGVIVRALNEYGLERHVRVSVGTRSQNRACVAAIKAVLRDVRIPAEA